MSATQVGNPNVPESELWRIFGYIQIQGDQIENGAEVLAIVQSTLGCTVHKASVVAAWTIRNWRLIYRRLRKGVATLISWIRTLRNIFRGIVDFWEWLASLTDHQLNYEGHV
jgi:hypothetical protein